MTAPHDGHTQSVGPVTVGDPIARGAQLGEAFAGLGRKIPEGAAVRRSGPSGPLDPAALIAAATVRAIDEMIVIDRHASGDDAVAAERQAEADLAADIRKALESYR